MSRYQDFTFFAMGGPILLSVGCSLPSSKDHNIVLLEASASHSAEIVNYNDEMITLRGAHSGFYYLREIIFVDRNGKTLLEVGDDSGMRNYPSQFVVAGLPFTIHYSRILDYVVADLKDSSIWRILADKPWILEMTYCFAESNVWPMHPKDINSVRAFTLAIDYQHP